MALIKIPNVTLHRSSLANASRIIKLNMADQSFDQALIDSIPTLVPYGKAVSRFFHALDAAWFVHKASTTGWLLHGSPKFYRNDINQSLKKANFNFWYESGAPLPDTPPILITVIGNMTGQVGVPFADAEADTTDNWAGTPTSYSTTQIPPGMTFIDGVFGGTPTGGSASYNPLVTAVNSYGDTDSNVFNISIAAEAVVLVSDSPAPAATSKKKKSSKKK